MEHGDEIARALRTTLGDNKEMVEVPYACECGAAQVARFFPHEHVPDCVICNACGAGRGMSEAQQTQHGIGMIRVKEEHGKGQVVTLQG